MQFNVVLEKEAWLEGGNVKSLSELVGTHSALIRTASILAGLSGLSTQLPIEPLNELLSFALLSMAVLLWFELRSQLVPLIALDRRFLARMLTATSQLARLFWFIMMVDVAAFFFVAIWIFAYPETTGRLVLIEVFLLTVPFVVSRIVKRAGRVWRRFRPEHGDDEDTRHVVFGAGYLMVSMPILVIACIYLPDLVEFIRDGLGLPR
jgi:hypothetical protein